MHLVTKSFSLSSISPSTRVKKFAVLVIAVAFFAPQPRVLSQNNPLNGFADVGEVITSMFPGGFVTSNHLDVFTSPSGSGPSKSIMTTPDRVTAADKIAPNEIMTVTVNRDVNDIKTSGSGNDQTVTSTEHRGHIGGYESEGVRRVSHRKRKNSEGNEAGRLHSNSSLLKTAANAVDALYAVSSTTLYVSRDSGTTWIVDTAGLGTAYAWDIDVDTSGFVYAATTNGLFIQNPDTNAWHQVTTLTQATNLYRVFVDRKNRILVGGNGSGVYLSTNSGATWSVDTTAIGNQSASFFADDAFGNLYVVTNYPISNFFYHIYKSSGGTAAWQEIDGPIESIAINNIAINALLGDSALVAGTSFGLFVSTDQGTSWVQNNNGIATENFTGFLQSPTGKWFTGTGLGLYSKNQSDTSWTKSYPLSGFNGQVSFAGDRLGNFYVSTVHTIAGGPIEYKSTDNGSSWNPDTTGVSLLRTGVFFVDEAGGQHLGTSQWGSSYPTLLYTKPLGGSWMLDTSGFTSTVYSFSYSISSNRHGYLYLTGSYFNGYGGAQVNARVMRRPISGGVWVPDTNGLGASVNYLSNLGPDKDGNMMGIAGSSLYKLSNGTWGTVSLPSRAADNFYYINNYSADSSGAIFASFSNFSGGGGIYFTTDGGTSWTYAGLDSLTVNQLISYGDSTYVSTTDGLYILTRNSIGTAVRASITTPAVFALEQNYPNPFNPTTNVRFTIGSPQYVTLKIYDVLGREVTTLVHEKLSVGNYTVPWNASNNSSGVYFYRLKTGNFVETKKMVLMK
jgi:photosystem II stability/assembly factor-like uncharacterized protein